jgi:hypothetical protein
MLRVIVHGIQGAPVSDVPGHRYIPRGEQAILDKAKNGTDGKPIRSGASALDTPVGLARARMLDIITPSDCIEGVRHGGAVRCFGRPPESG